MVERWTQERRRQRTRELLLDAAEQLFASRGFDGTSLDEVADAAGYTRGAIYGYFPNKEELFLAVNERVNERFLGGFQDLIDSATSPEDLDLEAFATRWREMQTRDLSAIALGMEFTLYSLRNPALRQRVTEYQMALVDAIATIMEEQASRLGVKLRVPGRTLALIVLAASDGLELTRLMHPNEDDPYEPFLELLLSAWDRPPTRKRRTNAALES